MMYSHQERPACEHFKALEPLVDTVTSPLFVERTATSDIGHCMPRRMCFRTSFLIGFGQ